MSTHPTGTLPTSEKGMDSLVAGRRVLDEPALVRFTPGGVPLALRWREGLWQVIGEPMSWFNTRSWWEPGPTLLGGSGSLLRTDYWRFRTQTGPVSPVLEFEMSTDAHTDHCDVHGRQDHEGRWWLRRVDVLDVLDVAVLP